MEVTTYKKDTVRRMAGHGMNLEMVAAALGVCEKTFINCKELHDIYKLAQIEVIEKIGDALLTKAAEEKDNVLMIFALKTRGRWREQSFITLDDFEGSYADKKKCVDEALREGRLSVENYQKISQAIADQYKTEEMEVRLAKIEMQQKQSGVQFRPREDDK